MADFDYVVCVRIVCLFDCVDVKFLGSAIIIAFAIAIILSVDVLRVFCQRRTRAWFPGLRSSDFCTITLILVVAVYLYCLCVYIGLAFFCRLSVAVSLLEILLSGDLRSEGSLDDSFKAFL